MATPRSLDDPLKGGQLGPDDLVTVLNELVVVADVWQEIGLGLKLKGGTLSAIKAPHREHQQCLREMLRKWLDTALDPSWRDLVQALRNPIVGKQAVARELEEKYCRHGTPHVAPIPPKPREDKRATDKKEEEEEEQMEEEEVLPQPIPEEEDDNLAADGPRHRSIYRYRMRSKPHHGHCLIINNEEFDDTALNRQGSSKDADRLRQTFTTLRYIVYVRNNLTCEDIRREIQTYAERIDHTPFDSFVCCILSHGEEGVVKGRDSKRVSISALARMLTGCKSLHKKPKLFFIQACQGSERPPQLVTDDKEEANEKDISAIPRDSDFFFGYATTPHTVSIRNTECGSWYIKELCEVLNENRYDLVGMVTMVHNQVATHKDYQFLGGDKSYVYRQQPQMVSTLRHLVIFPKK